MTVLSWKDTQTPDFRGVNDGLDSAARLFESGMNSLRKGYDDIKNRQEDSQSAEVLAKVASYTDPGKLQEDLHSGVFWNGFDMKRLKPADIRAVTNRPGEILAYAKEKTGYDQTQKAIGESDYFRDHRDVFNGYLQAHRNLATNPNALKEFLADEKNAAVINGADSGLLTSFIGRAQDLGDSDLRTRGTQFSFANDVEAKDVGQATEELTRQLAEVMPDERMATLRDIGKGADKFTPAQRRAYDRVWAQYANLYPGAAGSGAAGGAGGGGGIADGDHTRIMNYQARDAGFATVPDSVKTLGQASDFATQVNRAGVPSSAMGTYQITGDTLRDFAPRVFGADWQNVEFNSANQDKIAAAIFEDARRKGPDALRGRWTSLTAAKAAAIQNMPWEQARAVIAQGESGASLRDLQTAVGTVARDNNLTESARVAIKAQELGADRREPRAIANELTGKGGVYEGQDKDNLTQKIDDISKEYKISPAQAAYVIQLSDNGKKNWLGRQLTWAPGNDGLTVDINDSDVRQYGKLFGDPKALATASVAVDHNAQTQTKIAESRAKVEALTQQIKARQSALEAAGITQPDRGLVRLQQQLTEALAVEGGTAAAGAETAAAGAQGRGVDRTPEAPPKPKPIAKRPAVPANRAPMILANAAKDQSNAPWVKKAQAAAAKQAEKKFTPEQFAAAIAAQGGKSLLTR